MTLNYFLFFLLIVVTLYIVTTPDNHLANTASAIREVWTGSCRLNCRDKSYAVHRAGSSAGCVCETCPCGIIENVLRKCEPTTEMYSRAVDMLAAGYYGVLEVLSGMYRYMEGALDQDGCQRQAQFVDSTDSTSRNICFDDKTCASVAAATTDKLQLTEGIKLSMPGTSAPEPGPAPGPGPALAPAPMAKKNNQAIMSCTKCFEQGQVCMQSCPKAVKKK